MSMRSELVVELVRDLLGPAQGSGETLQESPLSTYITGVLQPAAVNDRERDLDEEAELPVDDETGEEDEANHEEIIAPVFSPALDPKSRPSVMGLSFRVTLEDVQNPALQLCVTWGRYGVEEVGRQRTWTRQSRVWVSQPLRAENTIRWLNQDGTAGATREAGSEASLHIRAVREDRGTCRMFIQFVNRIIPDDPERVDAAFCLYQPSIRVNLLGGARLQPMRSGGQEEESRLQFLYRNRPAFARGHLCSATWKAIDVERGAGPGLEAGTFSWFDRDGLPEPDRSRFTAPDVRTEFVPVYAVQAPSWDWDPRYGPKPEFDAELLSSSCDTGVLIPRLEPLVSGYGAWLTERAAEISALPTADLATATALLGEAKSLLERMKKGLEVLRQDRDARLGFCFANRAMHLQAKWSGRTLRWRPFQLAFMLSILESLVNPDSPDRSTCDLLWVQTGGGKTEAYLAMAAFVLAYRRRRALGRSSGDRTGAGTAVISRYTLRLLTLQQYRRALSMITACEFLRVTGLGSGPAGWRPDDCRDTADLIWGATRFSIGLWVGGELTPNRLEDFKIHNGAISILKGKPGRGEPAQVLNCPACQAVLAIPHPGLEPGHHTLHLTVRGNRAAATRRLQGMAAGDDMINLSHSISELNSRKYSVVTLEFELKRKFTPHQFNRWWANGPGRGGLELAALSAARPGYFPRNRRNSRGNAPKTYDFELWCPNPECGLASASWCEGVPSDDTLYDKAAGAGRQNLTAGGYTRVRVSGRDTHTPDGTYLRRVVDPWQTGESTLAASRVPIPATIVDDQVYRHPPSLLIATVDKLARLTFEPRAGRLFGNVSHFHPWDGYLATETESGQFPMLGKTITSLEPPEMILQDELHLLDGPLGSMVGLYELAVDELCRNRNRPVKYIASTATIREAESQVAALFNRSLSVFPPRGLDADDRFFLRTCEPHPRDDAQAGQLFVGVAAPGTGPLKPVYRIWSILLQAVHSRADAPEQDYFRTLAGYFNAVRELAGAQALTRQDIPAHLRTLARARGEQPRRLTEDTIEELSSRKDSTELPAILDRLNTSGDGAPDALLATSMFGTGVDVPRLSLMVVHGQPKTTSSYIQAAGRVGRTHAGLVVTFLRASRPRDLSHYEFFCGYHRQLYRYVEPVTVMPFSPGAFDLAAGPVMVALLRNGTYAPEWKKDPRFIAGQHPRMRQDVQALPGIMERRAQSQPDLRRPASNWVSTYAASELDRWRNIARTIQSLKYWEYSPDQPPTSPVVLGDLNHAGVGLPMAYENAPQSLREVEGTISIAIADQNPGGE
jgi:hypothetical protein